MKPRTKQEKQVAAIAAKISPISDKQRSWAFKHCFEPTAFHSKHHAWCSQCGGSFECDSEMILNIANEKILCPHCGEELATCNSRRQKHSEEAYFTVMEVHDDYEVCRHYVASKYAAKGKCAWYHITEVVQNWINAQGKEIIIARKSKGPYRGWDYSSAMEIRGSRQSGYPYIYQTNYTIHSDCIYPWRGILPILRRNGYTASFSGLPQSRLVKMLISDRQAEVLIKNKQFELLTWRGITAYEERTAKFWHAIRVANRQRYIVKDASMWLDYLDNLSYLGLDTHNAKYVCPKKLEKEHDALMRRRRKLEAAKKLEEQRKAALEQQGEYEKTKGRFFAIRFGDDTIEISVITSLEEMREEGREMRHCVFDNAYYKKKDSLILSAKERTGQRLETVEVSLRTFTVLQSRAKCNEVSPQHEHIITLVERNMAKIRQAASNGGRIEKGGRK